MTLWLSILCGIVLLALLYRMLEQRVDAVIRWIRHTDDRVSSLEVKDYGQDFRMDDHDKKLDTHDQRFQRVNVELKELGKDIGWSDNNRKTEVVKIDPKLSRKE